MAVSITIQSTPAQGQTYKLYPVFNGLPFVTTINRLSRQNLKYVADIYVNGTLVSTLEHNKDISAANRGIFDIGRIVENFIVTTTSNSLISFGFLPNLNSYKTYQIKMGAQYERYLNFITVSNSAGKAKFNFQASEHDVRVGDTIIIQNSSQTTYNNTWNVTAVSTNSITTDATYVSTGKGLCIEGERFYDNSFYNNPALGSFVSFAIPLSRPTRINVGETVIIKQDTGALYIGYNGEWLVTDKLVQNIGGILYDIIVTNNPYIGSTPVNGGSIYSKAKYNFTNLTTSTLEYAWDAAIQYEDINNLDMTDYSMNTTDKGKFLTLAPKTQKIALGEIALLSHFNTSIMGSNSIKKVVYSSYTSTNTVIDGFSYNMPLSVQGYLRVEVAAGTLNLANDLDFNNAAYYTVELQNVSGNTVSEILKYKIDTQCYQYDQKRFKWKNTLGGWDYYTFNMKSETTMNIERSTYRKVLKTVKSDNRYRYAVGDRGNNVYNVKAVESESVFSNWLNVEELEWLIGLYTSIEVYLIEGTVELPITIMSDAITIGKDFNVGLKSYQIEYAKAYNKITQRG